MWKQTSLCTAGTLLLSRWWLGHCGIAPPNQWPLVAIGCHGGLVSHLPPGLALQPARSMMNTPGRGLLAAGLFMSMRLMRPAVAALPCSAAATGLCCLSLPPMPMQGVPGHCAPPSCHSLRLLRWQHG